MGRKFTFVLTAAMIAAGIGVSRLANRPARGLPVPAGLRDAVNEPGSDSKSPQAPAPIPAGSAGSRESLLELESRAKAAGMSPEQDLLSLYMASWIAEQAAIDNPRPDQIWPDEPVTPLSQRQPLLNYRRVPVQTASTSEEDVTRVEFWTDEDAGVPPTRSVLRLYQTNTPEGRTRPFILFLPPSKDPKFLACKQFCRNFLENGMRCAYLEKQMGDPDTDATSPRGAGLEKNQAPPTSVITARRGLDALESMGVIRPGEKIGVGGVSMGAIEASLLALTDERIGAATLILGGGNIAKMLVSINGAGVQSYVRLREKLMAERGWTMESLERELTPLTIRWDPLAYIKAIPEERRLPADRFLMINVIGDPAISNERSDDLYNALTTGNGQRPQYDRIKVLVPSDYKHVGVILRLGTVKEKAVRHFQRYLQAGPGA